MPGTGFKTQSQIESQLAWPIGFPDRAYRDTKFSSARIEAPPDAAAASATLYATSAANVAPGDYAPPKRALGLQILPMEKPCVRLSTTHAAFPPPNQLHARLRACLPCLEAAFARLDVGGEGLILLSELRMLLTDAFAAAGQGEPEEAVVATLTNLYEREGTRRSDGKVVLSLVYASEGVAACADMLEEECTLGRPEALKRVSSLAVKEARAWDRTVSMEPSFEGTARPRLPPTSPVPSPHPTMFSTLALSSSGSALASPKPQKERESLPAVAQRSVPLGETLSVDPSTSLLVVADAASSSSATLTSPRLLTAGPMGSGEASSPRRGMNLGALRMAQLTGEAVLGGRKPPSSQTAFRLAGPAYVSSIMRDFGDYGSKPADLPVTEPGIAGYAQTIKELTAGTTRATLHPPFYTGHVPKEPHGASQAFGLGAEQRSSFHRSTNLIDNFKSRVSGYTGYLPKAALNQTVDVDKVRGVEAFSEYDHNSGAIAGYYVAVSSPGGAYDATKKRA